MGNRIIHWRESDGSTAELSQGPVDKYVRVYWATVEDVDVDPYFIHEYSKCPRRGDRHKWNEAARVVSVKIKQVGESRVYKVVVEWSTGSDEDSEEENPLKRPAKISIETDLVEVETFRDGAGNIRINTAGDIQVGTTFKPIQTITIVKNVEKIPKWFNTLPGSVNERDVKIKKETYKERTLLLEKTTEPDRILEGKIWYYPLTYTLTHNIETHDSYEPSMGYHELVKVDPTANEIAVANALGLTAKPTYKKRRITVGTAGDYPNDPQYLDIDGAHIDLSTDGKAKKAKGQKRGTLDTSKIYIIRRNDHPLADLNQLPRK